MSLSRLFSFSTGTILGPGQFNFLFSIRVESKVGILDPSSSEGSMQQSLQYSHNTIGSSLRMEGVNRVLFLEKEGTAALAK